MTAYFVSMTWCVAVGCNSNSFTKDWKKGLKFFRTPKDDNLKKKMASKYQEGKSTKNSNVITSNLPNYQKLAFETNQKRKR